jgi:hypothetical protein
MQYAYAYQLNGTQTGGLDPDAKAYILAVEAADSQALEAGVKNAYNTFVKGCKSDGIWDAIKASCIMAGARTLSGALVPLKGTAPTNFNFVSSDYNRETGLKGNGTTKYLDSNRNNNADPQNSKSVGTWTTAFGVILGVSFGSGGDEVGATTMGSVTGSTRNNCQTISLGGLTGYTGFAGSSRSSSAGYTRRVNSSNTLVTQASQTPQNKNIFLFASNVGVAGIAFSDNRISFYHIGESLDLEKLDSRVTTLMSNIATAMP